MDTNPLTGWPGYSPARLLNRLKEYFGFRHDSELAERLGIARASMCRLRSRTLPISATTLLRMHEESGLPTKELRRIMVDRRALHRHGSQIAAPKHKQRAQLFQKI